MQQQSPAAEEAVRHEALGPIDWVQPSMAGITTVQARRQTFRHGRWRLLGASALAAFMSCVLVMGAADAALVRLNTSIRTGVPAPLAARVGPIPSQAFESRSLEDEYFSVDRDDWADELLNAMALDDDAESKRLVQALAKRRAKGPPDDDLQRSLADGLRLVLQELRSSLAKGRLGRAREAALLAGAMVDAADIDPSGSQGELAAQVNFALLSRALLDDAALVIDVRRLSSLTERLLGETLSIEAGEDADTDTEANADADSTGTAAADDPWNLYVQGKEALSGRRFDTAVAKFAAAAAHQSNGWLRDLALLGEARSVYWKFRNPGPGAADIKAVQTRLEAITARLKSASFRSDVHFYLNELSQL